MEVEAPVAEAGLDELLLRHGAVPVPVHLYEGLLHHQLLQGGGKDATSMLGE